MSEIVSEMKRAGQSVNYTSWLSDLILSQRIPGYQHPGGRSVAVAVDYCPTCNELVPYHNGKCKTCRADLEHLTAISTVELNRLMAMARTVSMRKGDL